MSRAKLADAVDDEFLNQVGAIRDAGDKCSTGNRNSTEREPRTDRANKKRSHPDGDQGKLPNAGSDGEVVSLAEIESIGDYPERGQPKPRCAVSDALPPGRSKFLNRCQHNPEHERIEPGPSWIINPRLKGPERYALAVDRRILPSEKCAEYDSA